MKLQVLFFRIINYNLQLFKPNENQWNSQFGTTQFGNSQFGSPPDQNQTFGQPTNGFNQQPTDFSRLENAIEVFSIPY